MKNRIKGTLHNTNEGWKVYYLQPRQFNDNILEHKELPLYQEKFNIKKKQNIITQEEGKEIEFEIIDEFTHPELYRNVSWGDGIKYAKLISK